jgi:CRP/FNR family cyclic AMP-dependent transcriptional regulator
MGISTPRHESDWRNISRLAGITERELRKLCRRRKYARGEVIFHDGDPAGPLHLIDFGHVAIRLTTRLGDELVLDVLPPGETFGEQGVMRDGTMRGASALALDRVETLTLDRSTFVKMRDQKPSLLEFLLLVLSGRLRATNQQLVESRFLTAEDRLNLCLDRLASRFTDRGDRDIPLTQAQLASLLGVTRSTANRLLNDAQNAGLIEIKRGRFRISDRMATQRSGHLA